ncbi:MAG: ribose 5-phosphate isomerase A, partial [Thermoplasmata archaeon]
LDQESMKRIAAKGALSYLKENILVGMGSGTTIEIFIEEMHKANIKNLKFVASSKRIEKILLEKEYELVELEDKCDIYIDGADAVDKNLRLIKGGGGALTREKILAHNSNFKIIIVDETKLSESFKGKFLPVEVLRFSHKATKKRIEELGLNVKIRGGEIPYITDNGNYIFDIQIEDDIEKLNEEIKDIPGIVETGLFINLIDILIVGKRNGVLEKINKIS